MSYQLFYHPEVLAVDLRSIHRNIQERLQGAIEKRLLVDPVRYGEPMRRSLKGYRKLRVGDYRIIYDVEGTKIRIYAIGHRKEIYQSGLRPWP